MFGVPDLLSTGVPGRDLLGLVGRPKLEDGRPSAEPGREGGRTIDRVDLGRGVVPVVSAALYFLTALAGVAGTACALGAGVEGGLA